MSSRKTIVLTGASGFLGSHLTKALLELDYRLVVLKRERSNFDAFKPILHKLIVYNIEQLNFGKMFSELGSVDAVLHTSTCQGRNGESSNELFEANVAFPMRLLQSATDAKVKVFYNLDTILPKNLNEYALSKFQFAEWGHSFAIQNKIRFTNIKMEHIFGPGDSATKFTTHVIKSCLDNVDELKLTLGEQKREFIYVDDAVDAILKIMAYSEKTDQQEMSFEMAFEISSGESPPTIKEFVELVIRLTNSSTKANFGALPYRDQEVMDRTSNSGPLTDLGWTKKTDLASGIEKVIASLNASRAAKNRARI